MKKKKKTYPPKLCDRCGDKIGKRWYGLKDTQEFCAREQMMCKSCGIKFANWWKRGKK